MATKRTHQRPKSGGNGDDHGSLHPTISPSGPYTGSIDGEEGA